MAQLRGARGVGIVLAVAFLLARAHPCVAQAEIKPFTRVLERGATRTNYPTFGSFNVHAVEIRGVYYVALVDTDANGVSHVVVKQSDDGGQTWADFIPSSRGMLTIEQPPVVVADAVGRMHMGWTAPNGKGNYAVYGATTEDPDRLAPTPLVWRQDVGNSNAKFAMAYNPTADCVHWSRRNGSGDMELYSMQLTGSQSTGYTLSWRITPLITHVGNCNTDYWDAHYQSLFVDGLGRLHLIYTPHHWPNGSCDSSRYERVNVGYMYSDDAGRTFQRADGSPIALPARADNFTSAGTMLASANGTTIWGASLYADKQHVFILYHDSRISTHYCVRLERETGLEQARSVVRGMPQHMAFAADPLTGNLYLFAGDQLVASFDEGGDWSFILANDPPSGAQYFASTAYPLVTSHRQVIGLMTDVVTGPEGSARDAIFAAFPLNLLLEGPYPNVAGHKNHFDVYLGSKPDHVVRLYGSYSTGNAAIPECPGVSLNLGAPWRLLGESRTDFKGRVEFAPIIPSGLTGRTVYFSAVEVDVCRVSNLLVTTFD